jgi:hypothetical protein
MTLERYNQILWATIGTVVGVGALVLAIWLVVDRHGGSKGSTIVIQKPNEPKPKQDLVFCAPVVVPGANRQLFPVAVVNVDNPDSDKTVLPQSYDVMYRSDSPYSLTHCGFDRYVGSSRIFNVVVRDTRTSRQWSATRQLISHEHR